VQPVLRVSGRFLRLLTAWCARIEAATACRDVAGEGNGLIPSATLREWRIGSFRFDVCAGGRFLRLLTAWRARIEAATACRDVADVGNGLIPSATLREWRISSFRFDVCAGGRFLRLLTAWRARIEAATACRDVADVGNGLIPSATFMFG